MGFRVGSRRQGGAIPAKAGPSGPGPFDPLELIRLFVLAALCVVLVRTAWVCDDAYIAFRTVDNLVRGYGLTWNPSERVQAFTSPLWVLLTAALYAVTREMYYSCLVLSMALSLGVALLLAYRLSGGKWVAVAGLGILLFSKSFVDYSTSGLENPLLHLLIALFILANICRETRCSRGNGIALGLSFAAVGLTRLDALLLLSPALALALMRCPRHRRAIVVAGLAPLVLWEAFSLFYYGFPFPNTAYAKLNVGIPRADLVRQGLLYLRHSVVVEPLTVTVISGATIAAAVRRRWSPISLVSGVWAYLAYVVLIGGDFMGGRFLSAPLLISTILLVRTELPSWWVPRAGAVAAIVCLGLVAPCSTILSGADYRGEKCDEWEDACIADARGFFYHATGLLNAKPGAPAPAHEWARQGVTLARTTERSGPTVTTRGSIGFFGFFAGPRAHIVDKLALSDPLLARLPARRSPDWCVGHFERIVPEGYLESVSSGENRFEDQRLGEYYEKLKIISMERLLGFGRLIHIWKMNTGQYDHLIDWDYYTVPPSRRVNLADISMPKPVGMRWDDPSNVLVRWSALDISLGIPRKGRTVATSLRGGFTYEFLFYLGDRKLGRQRFHVPTGNPDLLQRVFVAVPEPVAKTGFDCVRLAPVKGDKLFGVGHVRILTQPR